MFIRLAQQYREFVKDLVLNLQALAIVLEKKRLHCFLLYLWNSIK